MLSSGRDAAHRARGVLAGARAPRSTGGTGASACYLQAVGGGGRWSARTGQGQRRGEEEGQGQGQGNGQREWQGQGKRNGEGKGQEHRSQEETPPEEQKLRHQGAAQRGQFGPRDDRYSFQGQYKFKNSLLY